MAEIEWKILGDDLRKGTIAINGFQFTLYNQSNNIFWAVKDGYSCSRKYPRLQPLLNNLRQTYTEKVRQASEENDRQIVQVARAAKALKDVLGDRESLELVWNSVRMCRNYLETGEICMSREDPSSSDYPDIVKRDQDYLICKLDKIADALFDAI